jgi:HK97 family phage major capsid protein
MAQGLLTTFSVGLMADMADCEPMNPEEPWGGLRIKKWMLVEVSITPTPANPYARLKDINLTSASQATLTQALKSSGYVSINKSFADQMGLSRSQASGTPSTKSLSPTTRSSKMTLADKIKAKQQEIVRTKDQIAAVTNSLDDTGAMDEAQADVLNDLTAQLSNHNKGLSVLENLERTLAQASGGAGSGQQDPAPVPRIETRSRTPNINKAGMALACVIKGLMTNKDPLSIARDEVKDLPEMDMLVRAATAPAVSGTPAWGGNLIQETWGPLVEAMYALTVYGRVPGLRLTFDGKVNLPIQNGAGNLAGDFISENGVIPVKSGSIGTTSLQPHTLGVISAFSKELMRRSVPSIQGIIQNQILKDTALTIDQKFLDNVIRTAGTRPAGLQDANETGVGNINAMVQAVAGAGNATAKEINTATRALLARVWAINAGAGGVWLMNPVQRLALEDKQDGTTGHFVFRDEIQAGRFRGFPILESTNIPSGVTAFIAGDSMAFGTELLPYFEQSDQATLHFESATPLSISAAPVAPATENTIAHPVISLFQQNLVAVKGIWTLDWRITRQAGVQIISATTGW